VENQKAGIRKALGLGEAVTFQGQVWNLEPLTFLDLADAEALGLVQSGNAVDISPTSVLWLMLRKADPSLTESQRDLCQYMLTPRETRALFTLTGDGLAAAEFMNQVITAAGLTATDEENADDAEAPAKDSPAKQDQVPKKARGGRRNKPAVPDPLVPATPATPTAE